MKKDKKWLLHEFRKIPCELQGGHGRVKVVDILPLIDQLDEQKKVEPLVVPKELGEWLACQKLGNEGSFFSIIIELEDMWLGCGFEEFITDNKKQLIEVIIGNRSYEIEKEKLYYIYDKSTKGYLGYNADKTRLSWYTSKFPNDVFTEQEIKEIDERYWPFALEVEK